MTDWRDSVQNGDFAAAEASMLAETDCGEGFYPINEIRAEFYESWADGLIDAADRRTKYEAALLNWQMWAACSTSGGEGTARMSEVHRVQAKLERLNADR
jgi:hypothetical protein